MRVNSAARRCATSRAPSSTTTAPMTVRLTYSSSSAGATAFSAETNGDRIEGTWEEIVTATGLWVTESGTVAPEETRLPTLAANPLAWLAVSWPSAAVYTQVTSISPVPRLDSVSGSAPELMKTAPVQYEGWDAVPETSSGWAATRSSPQKADAGFAGRMIPVTTSRIGPAVSRVPTFSPNLAAVAVVTAACTAA